LLKKTTSEVISELVHEMTSEVVFADWWSLVSPGPKLQPGARIDFSDPNRAPGITLAGEVLEVEATGRRLVRLTAEGASVPDAIDQLGHVPLPPYIRRPDTEDDRLRYQTIFARHAGSIAAPTARLHLDEALVGALDLAGIRRATVTLHVGYGTFKPVKVEDTRDHCVDAEAWDVSPETATAIVETRAAVVGGGAQPARSDALRRSRTAEEAVSETREDVPASAKARSSLGPRCDRPPGSRRRAQARSTAWVRNCRVRLLRRPG
jgi:S-adenosylmethionine:tRNA ribosyltransferase-isomerase